MKQILVVAILIIAVVMISCAKKDQQQEVPDQKDMAIVPQRELCYGMEQILTD